MHSLPLKSRALTVPLAMPLAQLLPLASQLLRMRMRLVLPLLALLCALCAVCTLAESGIDAHAYDPVTVSVRADGLGAASFPTDGTDYLSLYRIGVVSFLRGVVDGLNFTEAHMPLEMMTRTTSAIDAPLNTTTWTFQIVYLQASPATKPIEVCKSTSEADTCQRANRYAARSRLTLRCSHAV